MDTLMGELAAATGVLALGFSETPEGARTLARSSLAEGFDAVQRTCAAAWQAWAAEIAIPETPEPIRHEAYLSATVLKAHAGRTYPGALIASLSIPWGNECHAAGVGACRFLKLLIARHQRRPIELLSSVERRYHAQRPEAATWHWREAQPFDALPAGRALLIENPQPFWLHYGFDGWHEIADRPSLVQAFSIHGVRIDSADVAGHSVLDFTFYFPQSQRWAGIDFHVLLESHNASRARDPFHKGATS